jgi:transcriptional regulator with XRE-family HTH domain
MRTIVSGLILVTKLFLYSMEIKVKFGHKIKALREEKGFSIEYLANIANIDRTYISDIEKGKRNVSLLIIEKLSKAFEVNIQELFNYGE